MSYNYSSYVNTLQTLLVAQDTTGQANLNAMLPNIIDYAELRIYRELDLLTTLTPLLSTTTSANRTLSVPSACVVLQSANFITPASTQPDAGIRNPMRRVSPEYINFAWPSAATTSGTPSTPEYYAIQNQNANITGATYSASGANYTLLMAPAPDGAYVVEMLCTVRPSPLSATNTTTFLTTWLPDLFLAASMVFAAGYQRDYGQQSDDPQLAQSWESQYQLLKQGANTEEMRKKFNSQDWEPFNPSPLADQPR